LSYGTQLIAGDVVATMDYLRIERPDPMGYSVGGMISTLGS